MQHTRLNFALFWALVFVAAYRLPGGIAVAANGVLWVALLLIGPDAALDPVGTVLSRKWPPPVSALGFTAW